MRLDEDRQNRLQHWQQIALHACERSGRTDIPVIHPRHDACRLADSKARRMQIGITLHEKIPSRCRPPAPWLDSTPHRPRGGLTHTELRLAHMKTDFKPGHWDLGYFCTETAPVTALCPGGFGATSPTRKGKAECWTALSHRFGVFNDLNYFRLDLLLERPFHY